MVEYLQQTQMNSIVIEIGGKERKFSFGLGFLGELLEHFDMSISELGEKSSKNPFKYEPLIMFVSARYAADLAGDTIDFTLNDFIGWIDDDGGIKGEKMLKFNEAFLKSLTYNVPEQPQENKKKVKK